MEMPADHHLSFHVNDGTDVLTYGDLSRSRITLHGAASDMVLVFDKRRPLDVLRVSGDTMIAQQWLDSIDLS